MYVSGFIYSKHCNSSLPIPRYNFYILLLNNTYSSSSHVNLMSPDIVIHEIEVILENEARECGACLRIYDIWRRR